MTSGAAVAGELRSAAWAGSLPTQGPGGNGCAQIPGIVGMVMQYVEPLREWFDDLLGDPAAVAGAASAWEDVSRAIVDIPASVESARAALSEGDGRTIRALRERHEDLLVVSQDAAEWTAATGAALRLASRIVDAVRSFVCDFLTQLARFADELFSFTLNPFEVADRIRDFADAAFDLIASAGRLVTDLLEALFALGSLLQKLLPIIAEGLDRLGDVLAQMLPYVGAVFGFVAGGIPGAAVGWVLGGAAENLFQESSDVEELDPGDLDGARLEAWERAHGTTELTSLSDLVTANGATDAMGGEDATVVDVKKVIGPDGSVHWVVSLPSTQDWQFGPDAGALNDRDSNVALMMDNPIWRGAYERAVLEAMSDAGVPPGGDVVLTGFSQGGIMAANLAADGTFPYNTVGVVTNGSPIDSFDIPPNIPVYAFQHATDAVPMLDGNVISETPPNVHRIVLPGAASPLDTHNNDLYADSVAQWERQYEATYGTPPPYVDLFTGQVVDHSAYTAAER